MGSTSHLGPQQFADELRQYLWSRIEPEGADVSGRWLEGRTSAARSREYWRKILSGAQAMTTNDVEVLARMLDQSPYDFIRAARKWNSPPGELIEVRFGDIGTEDDDLDAVARLREKEPTEEQ